MISYPFISSLFTNILSKSRTIEGRFYVCPKMGYEINSDVLGQVLKDLQTPAKKYPLALMMPPRATGNFDIAKGEWLSYGITMFFLTTTYYGAGSNISAYTNTSLDSIESDWTDMQTSAISFIGALRTVQASTFHGSFRISNRTIAIQPISEIGIDNASGVRIDFELLLPYGCEPLEDYNLSDIEEIIVPI